MGQLLVSPKFASNFERVMKHYGCTEQEIIDMKDDIKKGVYPLAHYEGSFAEMAKHLNE